MGWAQQEILLVSVHSYIICQLLVIYRKLHFWGWLVIWRRARERFGHVSIILWLINTAEFWKKDKA